MLCCRGQTLFFWQKCVEESVFMTWTTNIPELHIIIVKKKKKEKKKRYVFSASAISSDIYMMNVIQTHTWKLLINLIHGPFHFIFSNG